VEKEERKKRKRHHTPPQRKRVNKERGDRARIGTSVYLLFSEIRGEREEKKRETSVLTLEVFTSLDRTSNQGREERKEKGEREN